MNDSTSEQVIRQLESDLRHAQLQSDVMALDRLIDDTLLFTGPDGSSATKADDLALHQSGSVKFREHEPSDMQIRVISADVVVVVLRTHLAGSFHGSEFVGNYCYTRVWVRRDAAWRIVAGHVSAIASQ